ncbi:MAG: adenylate/guanylate cyclase domain-containing protein, partial [Leptospiraceae bacterium]|nr:adenylate/guanylate cyclase domain-containing protein [Leptospiraceae bacterium]
YVVTDNMTNAIVNGSAVLGYATITILHTLALRKRRLNITRFFNYLTLVLDYALIVLVLIYYNYVSDPDNLNFSIKSPVLLILLLPLTLTAIQFRAPLVIFAFALFAVIYYTIVTLAITGTSPTTNKWNDYINGPALIVSDALVSRPILFFGVTLLLIYTIHRTIYMLRKIGEVESQKTIMSRYFSPEIAKELTSADSNIGIGRRQRVAILFSDIRNFTALSEPMDPEELAAFLGEFREIMIRAIFEHRGTLDKFVGDAIMATFGTPHPSADPSEDAGNALAAARAMLRNLDDYNAERQQTGKAPIQIGIGLHAGDVFAGNIGTGNRLEYTVIGDAVNTSSRIESLCKRLDARLLVSGDLLDSLPLPSDAERMPRVRVKGKSEPLRLFRIGARLSNF